MNWNEIKLRIEHLLLEHTGCLSQDTVEAVGHYINHDEYEMAFEGLCIDLMLSSADSVDWAECLDVARELSLDKESVFDAEFWTKLKDRSSIASPS